MINDPLYITILCFAILSAILTFGLLFFSFFVVGKRTFIFFLVINLLLVNTLHVFSYIINWIKDNQLIYGDNTELSVSCQTQAILMIFSSMSQEFWISTITIVFYKSNTRGNDFFVQKRKMLYSLFIILFDVLPFLLTLLFRKLKLLGINNLYCWVKQPTDTSFSPFYAQFSIYIIRWINIIICITYTIKILLYLKSLAADNKEEIQQIRSCGKRTLAYPLIQILGVIIPTIYRIILWINPKLNVFWMQMTIVICGALQSILFPICYGWNSGLFNFLIGGCKKNQQNETGNSGLDETIETNNKTINIIMSDLNKDGNSTSVEESNK